MPDIDLEALRAAVADYIRARDADIAANVKPQCTQSASLMLQRAYAYSALKSKLSTDTIIALLDRLAAAEAERDRLLRVANEAWRHYGAVDSELDAALAALDAKEPSDA